MKEFGENTKLYIEFLLNSLVNYCRYAEPKEDDIEEIFYHIHNTIYNAEHLTSIEKTNYFNDLKELRNNILM